MKYLWQLQNGERFEYKGNTYTKVNTKTVKHYYEIVGGTYYDTIVVCINQRTNCKAYLPDDTRVTYHEKSL